MAKRKIVAFIDILGFKFLVKQWQSDRAIGSKIDKALRESIEWIGGKDALQKDNKEHWQVRFFSDSIIITVPYNELGIINLIKGICCFQRQMFDSGILIRGAISYGEHLEKEFATLSPALIEAYELESEKAIYSRILISNKLLRMINTITDSDSRKEIKEYLITDDKKQTFLCYLIFEEDDPWFMGEVFYINHKRKILSELKNASTSFTVKEKYYWLAAFHNWCLRTTAEKLKQSDMMTEDTVWDFGGIFIKEIEIKQNYTFDSLLWSDISFNKQDHEPIWGSPENSDWIKEWPGKHTDDDEEESDREEDNYLA